MKHFGQATPLLLTVAIIELSDIAFAVGFPIPQSCETYNVVFTLWPLLVYVVMGILITASFSLG